MKFNILVLSIDNVRSKTVVAHNLAGNRGVSLQHALSLLENLPVVYQTNLSKDDAVAIVARLRKIGVKANSVPHEKDYKAPKENKAGEDGALTSSENVSPKPAAVRTAVAEASSDNYLRPTVTYMAGLRPDDRMPAPDGRRNFRMWAIVTAACCIGLIFVCGQVRYRIFFPAAPLPGSVPVGLKEKPGTDVISPERNRRMEQDRKQSAVTGEQMRLASAYADSAKACVNVNGAIAFYKLAISFNKHNMDAWYGLINAFSQAQMPEETQRAQVEMKKIFGESVVSLAQIVQRFGELLDMYSTEDGTFRIEYRSRRTEKTELLHETFLLAKAVGTQCNCTALSLFAHTGKNKGALVFLSADPVPTSYEDYIARASIKTFE